MILENLRDLVKAQPFKPFTIIMANGERLEVPHPDYIWLHPVVRGSCYLVIEDRTRHLNVDLVAGLEQRETPPRKRK